MLKHLDLPLTLILYLSKQFLQRFGLVLSGLTGILLLFDLLASANEILKFHKEQIFSQLITYALYRAPEILTLSIPFAALLSMMMILSKLVGNQELIAMRSAGISSYKIAGYLSLGIFVIITLHFLFANTVLSKTSSTLRIWAENDYQGQPGDELIKDVPGWFALDKNIINVERASDKGDVLYNVSVIQRNEQGLVENIVKIPRLTYDDDMWISDKKDIKLNLPLEPAAFSAITRFEREMSYAELASAIERNQYLSNAQKTLHIIWLQRKFAGPLGTLIMMLVAMPIALQIARRGQIMLTSMFCLLAGFSYFIIERLMLTLGESAYLPPMIAVWTPGALFFILCLWVLLLLEG